MPERGDPPERASEEPPRGWRLRSYFALLVALFVLTAAGVAAYVSVQSGRDGRRSAERDASFAASTAAEELGAGVSGLRANVESLAATPHIEQALASGVPCSLTFAGTGGLEAGHIDILRADGTVACSSRVGAGGAPPVGYGGAQWLRQVRRGELFLAPVADTAAGGTAILSARGIPGGIVAGFLALEPAGPGLARLYGGGGPVEFLVASADGETVLARSIDPGRWVGTSLRGTEFQSAAGQVEHLDLGGTRRLYAEAPVPGVGWRFFAGEEKDAALAASGRLRNRQLIIIIVGLALVLGAAFVVYRRVALPVTRLGTAVRSASAIAPPQPVAVSGPAEVAELGRDINGLIAAVNASEHNYRLLFERSPLPMWIHDSETLAILQANEAAVASYGYSPEEFAALTMNEIETPEPSRHRRKDGSRIEVRTIGHSVIFGDRPARFVLVEDVGERQRLEEQLRQAQRLEAIGRLAGGIAHDFNNLLTAIMGHTDLLHEQIPPDDPRREETEGIRRSGERAVALTRQLLTLGRGGAAEPVVIDVGRTILEVEPILRRLIRENIAIAIRLSPDSSRVRADSGQIEQVLVNLVVNAGDAMPEGGRLLIATSCASLDEDFFRLHPGGQGAPGRYALIEVADTGVGMDEETLSLIYEPFFTTKGEDRGTGLGLATVYGIVRQNGGFLSAYSEPGQGTSFKVYLPIVDADVETGAQPGSAVPLTGTGLSVLDRKSVV